MTEAKMDNAPNADDDFEDFCADRLLLFEVLPGWSSKPHWAQKAYLDWFVNCCKTRERVVQIIHEVIYFREKLPTIAALNQIFAGLYLTAGVTRPDCQNCKSTGWTIITGRNVSGAKRCSHCNSAAMRGRDSAGIPGIK